MSFCVQSWISARLITQLNEVAKTEGRSRSWVIRRFIVEGLQRLGKEGE